MSCRCALAAVVLLTLFACSAIHPPADGGLDASRPPTIRCDGSRCPCDPALDDTDCSSGSVCRATLDGEFLCMETCELSIDCADGAACINRLPGPPWVCWIGGPLERDAPCTTNSSCGFGMRCNRDGVCREVCYEENTDCEAPGLRCEIGACTTPVPPGSPCRGSSDCSPPYTSCRPETLYTCQAPCWNPTANPDAGTCPDGSTCTGDLDCLDREVVAVDQCTRTAEGSEGCQLWTPICILTTLGIRRCMRPCASFEDRCGSYNCLPDVPVHGLAHG